MKKRKGMNPVIKEVKHRLREAGFGYLKVHRGRGTGYGWLEIHRPNSSELLSTKEEKAICRIFDFDEEHDGGRGNCFLMLMVVAEMRLGLRPKQPICHCCGTIYKTEKEADDCYLRH